MGNEPVAKKIGELQVWWIRNVPNEPEWYEVSTVQEAIVKLNELAKADLADVSVESNVQGLSVWNGEEWMEWEDDDGIDICGVESGESELYNKLGERVANDDGERPT